MQDNKINKGNIVRIKEEYAFKVPSHYHYGEVIDIDLNLFNEWEINLKADLKYTHDSIVWLKMDWFEKLSLN